MARAKRRRNPAKSKGGKKVALEGLQTGDRVVVWRGGKSISQTNIGGKRPRGNPSKRKRRKNPARSAAQKAATRKMIAANKRARKNPAARRKRRKNPARRSSRIRVVRR